MKRIGIVQTLLLLIVVVGCTINSKKSPATESVTRVTVPASYSKPLIASWDLGDSTLRIDDNVSLLVLGIRLSGSDTKLFYALSGVDTAQFAKDNLIKIVDNNGSTNNLIEVLPLYGVEKLELGVMNFDPRYLGATELYLLVSDVKEETENKKLLIGKFNGPVSEDYLGRTYSIRNAESLVLAGYRVGMNLWLSLDNQPLFTAPVPQQTESSPQGATSTPVQSFSVPWIELSQGTYVQDEISFWVEKEDDKQVISIDVQLLSDGNAITRQSGSVIIPTPVIAATSLPTALPYP